MKNIALLFSIIVMASGICLAQTSGFTYQGKLADAGAPANGIYQFECRLFDTDTDGKQIGSTQTVVATVQSGAFTTRLDFGAAAFPAGSDRWLEISVRLNGSSDAYTVLSPRQQVNSVPFSVRSLKATNADNADNATTATNATTANTATTAENVTGVVPVANGGTGSSFKDFIDLSTNQRRIGGNKEFEGEISVFGAGRFVGSGAGLTNVPGAIRWQVVSGTSQQAQPNNGYLVMNVGEVSITLPTALNIGDIVRISSPGPGGWRIAQNADQSVLLTNLGLLGNWTPHLFDYSWQGVASSADGSKLIVVAPPDTRYYTSTDSGVNWVLHTGVLIFWTVACSADGTKLVALTINPVGGIYTSTDSGATWTQRDVARGWTAVASSSDGTKLVAAVDNGQIYTSIDAGENWTPHDSARSWRSVASSADGDKLVAGTLDHAGGFLYTSTDAGVTWTQREKARHWVRVASSADGAKLVALDNDVFSGSGGGRIYTSIDSGVTWTPRESNRDWLSVASSADGTRLVASADLLYVSADSGVTWTPRDAPRSWRSVATSADGSKLVAVEYGGKVYTSSGSPLPTTTIGTAGYLIGGSLTAIELQYVGSGQFIAISHEGIIFGF